MIHQTYCEEKLDADHLQGLKGKPDETSLLYVMHTF